MHLLHSITPARITPPKPTSVEITFDQLEEEVAPGVALGARFREDALHAVVHLFQLLHDSVIWMSTTDTNAITKLLDEQAWPAVYDRTFAFVAATKWDPEVFQDCLEGHLEVLTLNTT